MCKIFEVQLKVGVTSSGSGFSFLLGKDDYKDYDSKGQGADSPLVSTSLDQD